MPPMSSPSIRFSTRGWAFAIQLDEVVLARVVEAHDGFDIVKAYIYRITANQIFWPYSAHSTFDIPRNLILRVLPHEIEPPHIPVSLNSQGNRLAELAGPINLSQAAWDLFVDARKEYHSRIQDRSLAARKLDRQMQLIMESRAK